MEWQPTVLKKCLHVKGLSRNLFSVPSAVARGANISMTQTGFEFTLNGQKTGIGVKNDNLYHLKNKEDAETLTKRLFDTKKNGTLK
jgi:hypothetical protein